MAMLKGNQFWKLRSKHGRDKLFASPDLLWEAACEYFNWCDNNPLIITESLTSLKKGVELKEVPKTRPYTIGGFCLYCDASKNWWSEFKAAKHNGFLDVTARIDGIIYNQKFEGAASGLFNPNIIAQDLGLANKHIIEAAIKVDDISKTSTDELIKRAAAVKVINENSKDND